MVYCENHMTHTNPRCVPARKRITASYSAKTTAFIYTLKKKKDAAGFFDTPKLPTNYMVSLPSIQCRSKNEWTYTSFPPIRLHSMYREKHAFFFILFHITESHTPNIHRRTKTSRVLYTRPHYIY
jgi:hypothetical protein